MTKKKFAGSCNSKKMIAIYLSRLASAPAFFRCALACRQKYPICVCNLLKEIHDE